ncbi:hypothetical protein BP6252_07660 [Coleophoma cylindrospora]|uniref:Aminotransferase class I/classII large domain-containing protein n=1 Tax=Coleophoma cylindrospora TaxID=1849047 RepID=A0A3D8RAM3_9HELO|nr:hypothetical protein BP6252_07660 [Coleophoma cylindrospora]
MAHLPLINLQLGWPSRELLPASALAQAATDSMADYELACSALLYGPGLGNTPLRQAVAQWLSEVYTPAAGDIPVERISISGGASQNVANLLQVFTDAGFTRHVWMIEPVYHLASKIFEDAGFQGKLRGVPEDAEGCDVGYLRARLRDAERERERSLLRAGEDDRPQFKTGALYPKIYKHVIYCVPTFSNPSAKTMSLRRREELLCLAREFDALIITDDCYDVLRWPKNQGVSSHELGPLPPRLVDLDRTLPGGSEWGNTVSNGTFSKLVGPGIRVGWMESTSLFALGLWIHQLRRESFAVHLDAGGPAAAEEHPTGAHPAGSDPDIHRAIPQPDERHREVSSPAGSPSGHRREFRRDATAKHPDHPNRGSRRLLHVHHAPERPAGHESPRGAGASRV